MKNNARVSRVTTVKQYCDALTMQLTGKENTETSVPHLWRVSNKHTVAVANNTLGTGSRLEYPHGVTRSHSTLLLPPPLPKE